MKIEWLIINSLLVLLLYDSNNGELLAPLEKQIRKKCVEFCQSSLIALPNMDDNVFFGNCSWSCRVEQCSNGCSLFSMDSRFTCDKDCPVTSTVCETGCRTAESMYIYKVQALFEKSQAVIDRNSSQKIVLAWRLEPYDLSNLLFMNNRGQTNSLLLRVEIKRPNEQFYNVLNRNIGISPSLVTADLPLDEFAAGIYETMLTVSYKQRRISASKPISFEVPGSIDLASIQLRISTVQCLEPDRALVCWNKKIDKLLRISLLREDMTLIREDSTKEPCFLFSNLISDGNYVVQISVLDGNQQILLNKESLSCKFSVSVDLRPTLFYTDKKQIFKMADVNDYHQNAIVVHDQEKVEITAFAVSKINKSDIFFIATNDSQITIKQEYKIMATKKFLAGAIRSILVDQNEMKHFFIQTEFDIYSADILDSDIQFRRIFKSKHAIKSAVLDTFTCHIYVSTAKRVQSITLTMPMIIQNLNESLSNCNLAIDLYNRQLLCHNSRSELFYYDLVSKTLTLEKSSYLKVDAAKNYTNVRKMAAFNGTTFWLSSGRQCSTKVISSCLMADEFNPKMGFYVVNEYFLSRETNAELIDLALYVENMPPNLFSPTETTVLNNGSRISSWASNQSPFYFKAAQNCLDSTIKTTLFSINDQNQMTKIVQQSSTLNISAASTTTFFDMNPNFKDLNHTLMISNSICKNGYCSKTMNSSYFRMLDLNKQELESIYLQQRDSVIRVNILAEVEQVWDHLPEIGSMFCSNVSCFTVNHNGKLMELTMDSASVHNFPHSQTAIRGINYDSSTNKLYWFYKNGIYYANFDNLTENRLLAMISDVKSINVIPHEPIIIVCSGSQIFSIWKTGGYYRQHFICNSSNCEILSCTIHKSEIDNEFSIIYTYQQDSRTLLIMQLMNNGSVSSSRLELEISTNSRIVQIGPVSQTIFLIRDDKNRFGLLDAKLNVTNWFYFEDIMDFRLMRKGSQEIPKSSSTVKYVNISRSVDGLNISWTVEPVGNESHLFDITFYEPIFKGLYHVVTNDTYLIIDEPSDQHLSINITILNDYQSFKVQQFTLLVEEVAHYANLTAFPITPNCIGLLWTAYKTSDTKSIIYSTNITDNDSTVISLKDSSSAKCQDTVCSKLVCHTFIKPGTKYHCKIVGKTQQGVRKFETTTVGLTMKSLPGSLVVVDRTVDSLILNWTFFKNLEAKPRNIGFFYKKISDQKWKSLLNPEYQPLLESYSTMIKNLTSDSQYSIKYSTNYHSENVYNERFFQFDQIFEWTITAATLPDIYITPKMTNVEIVQKLDGNFTLQWKLSDPKVSVTQFIVMYRKNETSNWTSLVPALPPTSTSVDIPKKLHQSGVQFNVFTNSSKGYGPDNLISWPQNSSIIDQGTSSTTFILLTCIFMVLIISTIGGFLIMRRIRKKRRKAEQSCPKITVAFTNRSYGSSPDDDQSSTSNKRWINEQDLTSLPHVPRSCVTISRLIGSGAFGEVFEGLAYNLPKTGPKTCRVAIKSLRLNHQNSEKIKFLHEALLMSSMDHRNIVSLLGVCIEREPQWIILDLMEGGDLLSFLRSSRPTTLMPSQLCLNDLIQMSHDVASGCAYLENERHVHRDLAARNCLLTSRDPRLRIVKIGDFGMSRDVYEGDYYRVEGEGLLPVRWMAPESLIDGVFTVKTDVWSFGVLLWEIMSLGQQPYIGKSNFETMNFVRLGGRLEPPEACPQDIYHIMTQCWDSLPSNRKSFVKICDEISAMKSRVKETAIGEQPFPPNFTGAYVIPRDSLAIESGTIRRRTDPGSGSNDSEIPQPATFTRNSKNQSHRSLRRSGREKISKIFSSLRRKSEQPPPPVLPSKDVFEKPNVENESRRSDSAMSFTTTATGYEVALLKRQNNGAKIEFDHFTNDGIDNYGYCSSSATVYGSVDKKDEKPAPKMLVTEI